MRALILTGAAALALTACSTVDLPIFSSPLTPTQQQCLASNTAIVVKQNWSAVKEMSTSQKAAFAADNVLGITTLCGVNLTDEAKAAIGTAVMLAAD
jgi:hypothetical protein